MIKDNIIIIKNEIIEALKKSGRNENEASLIAVSKTKPVNMIKEAYDCGMRDFGENKVQELVDKYDRLPNDIRWHLIGHLQTNKVKYIIDKAYLIHSVDSYKLAKKVPVADEKSIDKVATMISKSKKPMIFVGGGINISGASEELKELAEKIDSPVCDSMMGKGAFSGRHELYTGMLGMHGTKTSNYGVTNCDLLLAIGVRFSDRVTGNVKKFAPKAKIVHIDIDPAEINKNISTDAHIIGDAKDIIKRLAEKIDKMDHSEWVGELKEHAKNNPIPSPNKDRLDCPYILETLSDKTNGEAIVCTEVGQHQLWTSLHYKFSKPRTLISSGGLGTMGYGLGAAIGAKIGNKDKTVINIAGDGCFRMNMIELMTAARNKLPIIEIVIDNRVLGNVRQWQTLFYGKRYSNTVLDDGTDFIKIAEGMGAKAKLITTKEEFDKAIDEALNEKDTPIVLDCMIDPDDKVWPMVAPGAPINENLNENDY